ncbi:exopolysaccharide biosynthesis polyprenyl glycosylphosphotransferase [Bacillus sp. AGMB 02131]|uniref:Exopolysaccharide biosynthesis polyprenyl glycosylphosphotransferase n=1 Tax=Peribacillus faecalis TaxID=2772559 RepID=A0A927CSN3_9BACI|nr:exopolysaccharide biosynthesis polyprenyl glycosylphosphotransferase [Peribacillus faecalis]MBD3107147.1 exopolysaccharide biosynthesis polyprenyl glycosylphosphotransferase [Peribacillus faecalis]
MNSSSGLRIVKENNIDGHNININTQLENYYVKRLMDIVLCCMGLFIVVPIILITALIIKLETKGPIFYVQERLGLGGRVFKLIKLRSMMVDAEKHGMQWAQKNDPRVTKVGYFIRKTRIDELPQLFNVLKGDMTLIGPRPERPEFTALFEKEIPGFVERLSVLPGVTGWAQVNGGYDISPKEKLMLDLEYIQKQSLKMDLLIISKTIWIVLTGKGAR